jgi:hypothetical protein
MHALKDRVSKMIVMGSISRMYPEIINTEYAHNKQELAEACRLISLTPTGLDLLHLDLSFIEGPVDSNNPSHLTSDYTLKFNEITNAVNFWLENPKIRQLEFRWKLTPLVHNQLKSAFPNLDPSRVQF